MNPMTIEEVYEKYKHLDPLLTNLEWMAATFEGHMLMEFWWAIKAAASQKVDR